MAKNGNEWMWNKTTREEREVRKWAHYIYVLLPPSYLFLYFIVRPSRTLKNDKRDLCLLWLSVMTVVNIISFDGWWLSNVIIFFLSTLCSLIAFCWCLYLCCISIKEHFLLFIFFLSPIKVNAKENKKDKRKRKECFINPLNSIIFSKCSFYFSSSCLHQCWVGEGGLWNSFPN